MGCGRPKLAMALFNERLPEILDAKLAIACHDELMVESFRNNLKRWPGSWRRRWSPRRRAGHPRRTDRCSMGTVRAATAGERALWSAPGSFWLR